jgi:hypothetical protein
MPDKEEKFHLTYSEAILIRKALDDVQYASRFSPKEKEEAERLGWKIKDAFC